MERVIFLLILASWTTAVIGQNQDNDDGQQSSATVPVDTIPSWNIHYGKLIFIQGNINQKETEKRELRIQGEPWELVVTFNYDTGPPGKAELTIKQRNKTLAIIDGKNGDHIDSPIPVIGGGSFFVVPLKDIIDLKSRKGLWELDFYYSDQRGQKDLKLGTIIFKT